MRRTILLVGVLLMASLAGCIEQGLGTLPGSDGGGVRVDGVLAEAWRVRLDEDVGRMQGVTDSCVAVDDARDVAFIVYGVGFARTHATAVDLRDGTVIWRTMGPEAAPGGERLHTARECALAVDGTVFAVGGETTTRSANGPNMEVSTFMGLDAGTGKRLWRHDAPFEQRARTRGLFAVDGGFVAASQIVRWMQTPDPARLALVNTTTGETAWAVPTVNTEALRVVDGDRVLVAGSDEREIALRAHDAASGEEAWRATAPLPGYFLGRMAVSADGGTAFVRSGWDAPARAKVASVDVKDGSVLWLAENFTAGGACCGPYATPNGVHLVGWLDMERVGVIALARETGERRERAFRGVGLTPYLTAGDVTRDGNAVYVLGDARLVRYDVAAGTVAWADVPGAPSTRPTVAGLDAGGALVLAVSETDGGDRVIVLARYAWAPT